MGRSAAWNAWSGHRAGELDLIEAAHSRLTGSGRGRRWESEYLNCALITRLSAEFQGFSRDLLTDAVDHTVSHVGQLRPAIAAMLRGAFLSDCALSKGNPTWTVLATDFSKLGLNLREAVDIAHADGSKLETCRKRNDLTLVRARRWRSSLNELASGLDHVVAAQLKAMTGTGPW